MRVITAVAVLTLLQTQLGSGFGHPLVDKLLDGVEVDTGLALGVD